MFTSPFLIMGNRLLEGLGRTWRLYAVKIGIVWDRIFQVTPTGETEEATYPSASERSEVTTYVSSAFAL